MLRGDGSRRTVVLRGLGGVGKTQLAIAYAKWHKKDDNSTKAEVCQGSEANNAGPSLSQLVKQCRFQRKPRRGGRCLEEWLSLPSNTIYDNYDNPNCRETLTLRQ
jgi:hypothetical protein